MHIIAANLFSNHRWKALLTFCSNPQRLRTYFRLLRCTDLGLCESKCDQFRMIPMHVKVVDTLMLEICA